MQEDEEDEDGRGGFIIHRYEPLPAHRAVYDASYSIYRSLHPALAPAFKALAELTGSVSKSEPEPEPDEPEPEPELKLESESEAKAEAEVTSEPEPGVDPQPEPEFEPASGKPSGISTI